MYGILYSAVKYSQYLVQRSMSISMVWTKKIKMRNTKYKLQTLTNIYYTPKFQSSLITPGCTAH
jgi:hypothetical protein